MKESVGKRFDQEGGYHKRQRHHISRPTLEGHLNTLDLLRQEREGGVKDIAMHISGPVTLPIGDVIGILEQIIEDLIGKLPKK